MKATTGFRGWTFGVVAVGGWLVTGALGACVDDDSGDPVAKDPIEIAGTWESNFGDETITSTAWTNVAPQAIVSYDNTANVAITKAPADAQFAPNTYSRVVWTEPANSEFYYCTTAFGLPTAEAAEGAPEAGIDRNDLGAKGCAGFAWSQLTKK